MKRIATGLLLTAMVVCVGCGKDFYARQIIEHGTNAYNTMLMRVAGSAESLLKQKRIDAHRTIAGAEGTKIDVWVIKAKGNRADVRGTALLLHGLSESKAQYLGAGTNLARMGYDVVLPDLRAHGRSRGLYVTYGALEKLDVKAVMDNLIGSGTVHKDVYVFGATLGAATAIQYAALDTRCKGVLALTPYKDAPSIARRRIALLAPTMSEQDFEDVLARAGQLAHFEPHKTSTELAAVTVQCPLLLVHGLLDMSVPLDHSRAILAAAAGPRKLIVVTPGPEQIALAAVLERWIADKLDALARTGLKEEPTAPKPPTTEPASRPTTKPAPKT